MKRLLSLDILRGITVCGMILVNNAGGSPPLTEGEEVPVLLLRRI